MNELSDKLIIRTIFALCICLAVYLYRYTHSKLYLSSKDQMKGKFFPEKNSADTLHLLSKLLGIGIIFSGLHLDLKSGLSFGLFDFFASASLTLFFYAVSIYIMNGITLYSFEYEDEVLKRKNYSYVVIFLAHCLSIAFILKTIFFVNTQSGIHFFFLWILSITFLGIVSRIFSFLSKFSIQKDVNQMNIGVSLSYMGFLLGQTIIIGEAVGQSPSDIKSFTIQASLKMALSLIILPVFIRGLTLVFRIQNGPHETDEDGGPLAHLGRGISEGGLFLSACYLTKAITENIHFGSFYP